MSTLAADEHPPVASDGGAPHSARSRSSRTSNGTGAKSARRGPAPQVSRGTSAESRNGGSSTRIDATKTSGRSVRSELGIASQLMAGSVLDPQSGRLIPRNSGGQISVTTTAGNSGSTVSSPSGGAKSRSRRPSDNGNPDTGPGSRGSNAKQPLAGMNDLGSLLPSSNDPANPTTPLSCNVTEDSLDGTCRESLSSPGDAAVVDAKGIKATDGGFARVEEAQPFSGFSECSSGVGRADSASCTSGSQACPINDSSRRGSLGIFIAAYQGALKSSDGSLTSREDLGDSVAGSSVRTNGCSASSAAAAGVFPLRANADDVITPAKQRNPAPVATATQPSQRRSIDPETKPSEADVVAARSAVMRAIFAVSEKQLARHAISPICAAASRSEVGSSDVSRHVIRAVWNAASRNETTSSDLARRVISQALSAATSRRETGSPARGAKPEDKFARSSAPDNSAEPRCSLPPVTVYPVDGTSFVETGDSCLTSVAGPVGLDPTSIQAGRTKMPESKKASTSPPPAAKIKPSQRALTAMRAARPWAEVLTVPCVDADKSMIPQPKPKFRTSGSPSPGGPGGQSGLSEKQRTPTTKRASQLSQEKSPVGSATRISEPRSGQTLVGKSTLPRKIPASGSRGTSLTKATSNSAASRGRATNKAGTAVRASASVTSSPLPSPSQFSRSSHATSVLSPKAGLQSDGLGSSTTGSTRTSNSVSGGASRQVATIVSKHGLHRGPEQILDPPEMGSDSTVDATSTAESQSPAIADAQPIAETGVAATTVVSGADDTVPIVAPASVAETTVAATTVAAPTVAAPTVASGVDDPVPLLIPTVTTDVATTVNIDVGDALHKGHLNRPAIARPVIVHVGMQTDSVVPLDPGSPVRQFCASAGGSLSVPQFKGDVSSRPTPASSSVSVPSTFSLTIPRTVTAVASPPATPKLMSPTATADNASTPLPPHLPSHLQVFAPHVRVYQKPSHLQVQQSLQPQVRTWSPLKRMESGTNNSSSSNAGSSTVPARRTVTPAEGVPATWQRCPTPTYLRRTLNVAGTAFIRATTPHRTLSATRWPQGVVRSAPASKGADVFDPTEAFQKTTTDADFEPEMIRCLNLGKAFPSEKSQVYVAARPPLTSVPAGSQVVVPSPIPVQPDSVGSAYAKPSGTVIWQGSQTRAPASLAPASLPQRGVHASNRANAELLLSPQQHERRN